MTMQISPSKAVVTIRRIAAKIQSQPIQAHCPGVTSLP